MRKADQKLKGYRSGFEKDIGEILQPHGFSYEPEQLDYVVHRKYTPDWVFNSGDRVTYVEAKGYFRPGDTQKYKAVSDALSWTEELVFILMRPNHKVSKNTKLTMSQWCDKHNIKWYTIETLQELIDDVNT